MRRGADEAMGAPPRIVRMADLADEALIDIYERVLRPAFRPEELLDLEDLVEGYTGSDPAPNAVLLQAGRPMAVLLTEWYVERRVLLLTYVAVAEEIRGHGAGTLLADDLDAQMSPVAPRPIAIAEVDDPRVWPGDATRGDAEARLRFYDRRGARLVPVTYFQPSLRGLAHRVPGMFLIRLDSVDGVAGELTRQFLAEYFTTCEGASSLQDPQVVELLRAVDGLDARHTLPPLSAWRGMPLP